MYVLIAAWQELAEADSTAVALRHWDHCASRYPAAAPVPAGISVAMADSGLIECAVGLGAVHLLELQKAARIYW
jgi:hypothetical protein